MENEKISIIVPVYNIEEYIERCVNSIINQTYKNLEIILVDDGSNDNSSRICDYYKAQDDRIKVYHKKNGGLSDARNFGLKMITTNLVCFIDGDDYIETEYIEILYRNLKKYQADISVCGFSHEKNNIKKDFETDIYTKTLSVDEALKEMINLRINFSVCAWNKLYKKNLFNGIEYPNGEIYEDVATTYKLIMNSRKIVYTSKSLYNHCFNPSSITRSETFNERELVRLKQANCLCSDVVNKYPSLSKDYISYKICQHIAVINVMIKSNVNSEELVLNVKSEIDNNLSMILKSSLLFEKKVQIILFKFSFKIYRLLFKLRRS